MVKFLSKKNNQTLWETTDYKGRIVTLSTDKLYHAIKGHPEVADLEEEIRNTIEEPSLVVQSVKYENTEIHSRYGIGEGTLSSTWLHVPVLYQVGDMGDILTIYTSLSTKPGEILYANIKI